MGIAPNEEASGACYSQSLAQVDLLILIVEMDWTDKLLGDSVSHESQALVQDLIGEGWGRARMPRV